MNISAIELKTVKAITKLIEDGEEAQIAHIADEIERLIKDTINILGGLVVRDLIVETRFFDRANTYTVKRKKSDPST